jgi:transcriptional regulator with XRE-family HTH domain
MAANVIYQPATPWDLHAAARLRLGREQAGISLDAVSETLDWPTRHLTALEQGRRLPTLVEVIALARLYQLDPEFFLPLDPDASPETDAVPAGGAVPPHLADPRASATSHARPTFPEAA